MPYSNGHDYVNDAHEMEQQQKKLSQPGTSSNTVTTTTYVVHEQTSRPTNSRFPMPKLSDTRHANVQLASYELMANGSFINLKNC